MAEKEIAVDVTVKNIDEFKEKYPRLYQEAFDAGEAQGAETERLRIQGIEEAALPGYEAVVAEAKADGKSTASDVAVRIVRAEKDLRARKLEEIRSDGPLPVPAVAVDGVPQPAEQKGKGFMALVDERQASEKCSRGEAIKAVAAAHPEAHEKWLDEQKRQGGRI